MLLPSGQEGGSRAELPDGGSGLYSFQFAQHPLLVPVTFDFLLKPHDS